VGTETQRIGRGEPLRYNTALLIGPEGRIEGRYHKTHLVMFGEYLPFGDTFPWLYRLTPMTVGLTPGERPEVFEVAGFRLAPSICFESTVPHLIRRQLAALDRAGQAPDLLVNVTNDGWFWGSSILDYHFACTVFRAVEHRRPMLVAANTGLSTYVDSYGRVLAKGPRRQQDTLFCEVPTGRRSGWYQQLGDLPACGCLLCCGGMALVGLRARRRSAKAAERLE
jgi:apolipoprotein N-acyltransferase